MRMSPDLQLADLLAQPGDRGGVFPGLLVPTVAEDALHKSLLPSLNLPGVDFIPGGQLAIVSWPFTASSATLALKARLCFLRPLDISRASWQQPLPSV